MSRVAGKRAFDVVVIGGGFAGSSLAAVLAQAGLTVAIVEQTPVFADRVRGEALAPWGVAEARRLGLLPALYENAAARQLVGWATYSDGSLRTASLAQVDPHGEPILSFLHVRAQQALWALAGGGVVAFRPARVERLRRTGDTVAVMVDGVELLARLIVGADGRASMVRRAIGRRCVGDRVTHTVTGMLAVGTRIDPDAVLSGRVRHGRVLLCPIDAARTRVYYMAERSQARRLRRNPANEVLGVCRAELEPGWFADAVPAGPAATFPNADRWVSHPFAAGIALIGDAAGSNDPSIGQGLSLALRDVRALSDALLSSPDWAEACAEYGRERLRYFQTQRMVARWTWEIDEPGVAGSELRRLARRARQSRRRSDLMRQIRLDPAAVVPDRRARRLVLYGDIPAAGS